MGDESLAATQRFIAHWRSLITDGLVPHLENFLNSPSPELQPNVILVDVNSATNMNIRLLGTGLVRLTGRELTKTNPLEIYAPHLREHVGRACMTMLSRPCGHISERMVNTAAGLLVPSRSVALPLRTRNGISCLAGFSNTREAVAVGDTVFSIQDIVLEKWIDIGAGVPENI